MKDTLPHNTRTLKDRRLDSESLPAARQGIIDILARGFLRYRLRQEKKMTFPLDFLGEKSDSCDGEATIETSPAGEKNRCRY